MNNAASTTDRNQAQEATMSALSAQQDSVDFSNDVIVSLPGSVVEIAAKLDAIELDVEMALVLLEADGLAYRLDADGTRWTFEDARGNKVLGSFEDLLAVVEGGGRGEFNASF